MSNLTPEARAGGQRPPERFVVTVNVASFFAGIGGFDLGFERAGMKVVFQCEIDSFAQQILRKHWPEVPIHADINTIESVPSADLWCAGWPCQDISAGNSTGRLGLTGERSGLIYRLLDLLGINRPQWVVLENVSGLLSANDGAALEAVIDGLETIGYVGGWMSCNTVDAGLPQNRDRVFLVGSLGDDRAHRMFLDGSELSGDFTEGTKRRQDARPDVPGISTGHNPTVVQRRGGFGYTSATGICPTIRAQTGKHQGGHSDRPILCGEEFDLERVREPYGVSGRLDGRRGRLIGNAVSPVVVEWIGRRIMDIQGACWRATSRRKVRESDDTGGAGKGCCGSTLHHQGTGSNDHDVRRRCHT
jgi:DNA (cytosine-5)-methyltransferase 1